MDSILTEPPRRGGQRPRSTFLFVMPSFLDGFAQVFNMWGRPYASYAMSTSTVEADNRATRQDWSAVGDSLRSAQI
jgi:hypothetical protein